MTLSEALQEVRQRDRAFLDAHNPYQHLQAIHEIWPIVAEKYGDIVAIKDPHNQPAATLTYRQLGRPFAPLPLGCSPSASKTVPMWLYLPTTAIAGLLPTRAL